MPERQRLAGKIHTDVLVDPARWQENRWETIKTHVQIFAGHWILLKIGMFPWAQLLGYLELAYNQGIYD